MDCINLNQLLQVDSEETPSGADLEYDPLFGEMERTAQGKEERQLGDELVAAQEPDWPKLKRDALAVLEHSKDLRAAVQLARALVRTDGYAGLASGLELIKGYVRDFWDTLHPQPDPEDNNDPTIRINTLLNLCDPIEFLLPISKLPLVSSTRLGSVSYRDIQIASGAIPLQAPEQNHLTMEQVEGAVRDADQTVIEKTISALRLSVETALSITAAVNDKVDSEHEIDLQPLVNLLQAAGDELAERAASGNWGKVQTADAPSAGTAAGSSFKTLSVQSRDDVIRCLDSICQYYALREPSSPVPLLLQRARNLVTMDFREIVHDLAPDGQSHFDFLLRQDDG